MPTLRQFWAPIVTELMQLPESAMPLWPPDVFALCAYAVKQNAGYLRVLTSK